MNDHPTDMNGSSVSNAGKLFDQFAVEIHACESHGELVSLLRSRLLDIYEVDMASIFLVDSLKMQLVSWVVLPGESVRKIRIPIDKTSIAGFTASSRGLVFINDPHDLNELDRIDPELRFDSSWDRQTGTKTRQVLATPILINNSLLGVIQMMNKRNQKAFSNEDKLHIQELARNLGSALMKLQTD